MWCDVLHMGAKVTRARVFECLVVFLIVLQPNPGSARMNASLVPIARIDSASVGSLINNPVIQSFDLSPDGKIVAFLVVDGSKHGNPLLLVTEDILTKHITASTNLGAFNLPDGNFAPQTIYSGDGRYLIVQDLQSIRVLDGSSLQLLRTIPAPSDKALHPLLAIRSSDRDVFACAFGKDPVFHAHIFTTPVQIEVVDVASGAILGEWAAEDVPQAVSPDGKLVALSSSQAQRGVLPLDIVDAQGHKVAETTGGYAFNGMDQSKPVGRVIGVFVSAQDLLLTPDEHMDQTGHESGDSLQLVSVAGKPGQTIKFRHYGATGELASSANQKAALALSWYEPAAVFTHEGPLPASSPQLLVLWTGASAHVDAAIPIHPYGLKMSGLLENRRPRISSDGSVIAIAQDSGITVMTITATHRR